MTDAPANDLLLARLEEAFAADRPAEPTDASVAELRLAVTAKFPVTPARPRLPWWSKVRIAAAALIGTTALGAGVAFAAGAPLPGPLRSLAHGLGFPVDSPAVSAARHAEHSLEQELHTAHGTRPPPATAAALAARDAANLSHRLSGLGHSDRSRLGATPVTLLLQAHQLVPTVSVPASTVPTSTGPTGTTVPAITSPPTTTFLPPVTIPKVSIPRSTIPGAGSSIPTITVPKL